MRLTHDREMKAIKGDLCAGMEEKNDDDEEELMRKRKVKGEWYLRYFQPKLKYQQ